MEKIHNNISLNMTHEKTLIELFQNYNSNNNELHKLLMEAVEGISNYEDYPIYLLNIFNSNQVNTQARQVSGLQLKNYLLTNQKEVLKNEMFLEYLRVNLLKEFQSCDKTIRSTLNVIISNFIKIGGLSRFPDLSKFISDRINSSDIDEFLKTVETLSTVFDDNKDMENSPLKNIITTLIQRIEILHSCVLNDEVKYLNINILLKVVKKLISRCNRLMDEYYPNLYKQVTDIYLKFHEDELAGKKIVKNILKVWLKIFKVRGSEILFAQFEYFMNVFYTSFMTEGEKAEIYSLICEAANGIYVILTEHVFALDSFKDNSFIKGHFEQSNTIFISFLKNLHSKLKIDFCSKDINITSLESIEEKQLLELDSTNTRNIRSYSFAILELLSKHLPDVVFLTLNEEMVNGMNSNSSFVKEQNLYLLSAIGFNSIEFIQEQYFEIYNFLTRLIPSESLIVKVQAITAMWRNFEFTITQLKNNAKFIDFYQKQLHYFINLLKYSFEDNSSQMDYFFIVECLEFCKNLFTLLGKYYNGVESDIELVIAGSKKEIETILDICCDFVVMEGGGRNTNLKWKAREVLETAFTDIRRILKYTIRSQNTRSQERLVRKITTYFLELNFKDDFFPMLFQVIPFILDTFYEIYLKLEHEFGFLRKLFNKITNLNLEIIDQNSQSDNPIISMSFETFSNMLRNQYTYKSNILNIDDMNSRSNFLTVNLLKEVDKNHTTDFFSYISSLALFKDLEIITENMEFIVPLAEEILTNVDIKSAEYKEDFDLNYLISVVIEALGNLFKNYSDNYTFYRERVMVLILEFLNENTTELISKTVFIAWSKIASKEIQLASDKFLKKYILWFFDTLTLLEKGEEKTQACITLLECFKYKKDTAYVKFKDLCECLLKNFFVQDVGREIIHLFKQIYRYYEKKDANFVRNVFSSFCPDDQKLLQNYIITG
jgi:hypothetical protein